MRGLYRGSAVAMIEKFPSLALNFAVYDLANARISKHFSLDVCGARPFVSSPPVLNFVLTHPSIRCALISAVQKLTAGLISGSIAAVTSTMICFPFDLVMKRLQLGTPLHHSPCLRCSVAVAFKRM